MFSSGPNYTKLKTHLRLAISRLKLIEKKKTELAQKSRKEIADYISAGKVERAKIRVEHIIREDYLVEAMEVVEMYCDLLLARFGLLKEMKTLDDGLAEAISSILWVAPRLQSDITEMSVVSDQLTAKYGREYMQACREDTIGSISAKLKHKMSVQAPPKILIEKYLMEIAKNYNLTYEPDPQVMREEPTEDMLLDLDQDRNNLGGGGLPQPAGFIGFPQPPMLPTDYQPFNYKPSNPANVMSPDSPGSSNNVGGASGGASGGSVGGFVVPPPLPSQSPSASFNPASMSYNIPPNGDNSNMQDDPPPYSSFPPDINFNQNQRATPARVHRGFPPDMTNNLNQRDEKPKPAPRAKLSGGGGGGGAPTAPSASSPFNLPDLPSVPSGSFPPDETDATASKPGGMDDIDFDDLTRRFEELKKRK